MEEHRELTIYIVNPRVSYHESPATSLLTVQYYEKLQLETFLTRLKQKIINMTGKRNHKQASDKASIKGPTQRKSAPWVAKLNDKLRLCTANLTENEEYYDNSLELAAHLIRQPPPSDHTPDTVPVYIVTGGEEDDADYIFNNDDLLSAFDYDKPSRGEEIYNEFSPGHETLNESMLSIASH